MGDSLNFLRRRGIVVRNDQAITGREPPYTPGVVEVGGTLPPSGQFRSNPGREVVDIFDAHHYAKLNGSQPWPLAANTSTMVLPTPSTLRNMLILRNAEPTGGTSVAVEFGNTASAFSAIVLAPQDTILLDVTVAQDDVYAFAIGGTATLVVAYSNTPGTQL